MTDDQQRFACEDNVQVTLLSNPFYGWTGHVEGVIYNSNRWPYYRVRVPGLPETLVVADTELEKV